MDDRKKESEFVKSEAEVERRGGSKRRSLQKEAAALTISGWGTAEMAPVWMGSLSFQPSPWQPREW